MAKNGDEIPVGWMDMDRSKYDNTEIIDGRDLDWVKVQNETAKDMSLLSSSDVLLGTAVSNMFATALDISNTKHGYDIPYISLETAARNRFPNPAQIDDYQRKYIDLKTGTPKGSKAVMGCKVNIPSPTAAQFTSCGGTVDNLIQAYPEIKRYIPGKNNWHFFLPDESSLSQ